MLHYNHVTWTLTSCKSEFHSQMPRSLIGSFCGPKPLTPGAGLALNNSRVKLDNNSILFFLQGSTSSPTTASCCLAKSCLPHAQLPRILRNFTLWNRRNLVCQCLVVVSSRFWKLTLSWFELIEIIEHLQLFLTKTPETTTTCISRYKMLLRVVFDKSPIIRQTSKSPTGTAITSLTPNYLCLQCSTTTTLNERAEHGKQTAHRFCMKGIQGTQSICWSIVRRGISKRMPILRHVWRLRLGPNSWIAPIAKVWHGYLLKWVANIWYSTRYFYWLLEQLERGNMTSYSPVPLKKTSPPKQSSRKRR